MPHATQLLALMGAEVVKVEPIDGEPGRTGKPALADRDGRPAGTTFIRNNLNKSSVGLDLKSETGRDLFLQLAKTVDVVAENFRPGTADRLGIGYEVVSQVNPSVVYVSISGFGNRTDPPSPYREWPAYAPIVEGMAGLYEYSRRDDDPPQLAIAGALGDTGAGLYAVIGTLAALNERHRTGKGSYVDVSMYDSMIALADIVHVSSMGTDPGRVLAGIGILHSFRAADGWFVVEVVREPHFPRFARAVGHPEWTQDPRLATRAGWDEHMETVIRPAGGALGRDVDQAGGGDASRARRGRGGARQHRRRHPIRPARSGARLRPSLLGSRREPGRRGRGKPDRFPRQRGGHRHPHAMAWIGRGHRPGPRAALGTGSRTDRRFARQGRHRLGVPGHAQLLNPRRCADGGKGIELAAALRV